MDSSNPKIFEEFPGLQSIIDLLHCADLYLEEAIQVRLLHIMEQILMVLLSTSKNQPSGVEMKNCRIYVP